LINLPKVTHVGNVFSIGIFFFCLFFVLHTYFVRPVLFIDWAQEDSVFENITAIAFFTSCLVCLLNIFKRRNVFLSFVWFFLAFVFLGEETSWFQRVFDYNVAEIEAINSQGEFNFHNLNIIQAKNILSEGGAGSKFINAQNLFRAGFIFYFVLLPYFYPLLRKSKLFLKTGYTKPSLAYTSSVVCSLLILFGATVIFDNDFKRSAAEFREMVYSIFILLYVFTCIGVERSRGINEKSI